MRCCVIVHLCLSPACLYLLIYIQFILLPVIPIKPLRGHARLSARTGCTVAVFAPRLQVTASSPNPNLGFCPGVTGVWERGHCEPLLERDGTRCPDVDCGKVVGIVLLLVGT